MIDKGAAFSINNYSTLTEIIEFLMNDEQKRKACGISAKNYVYSNKGGTSLITNYVKEKRLLTN
jgi:3-deoxy-D-manno-octulosonic-acid transferase